MADQMETKQTLNDVNSFWHLGCNEKADYFYLFYERIIFCSYGMEK
jgi:hypothetical protein